MLPGIICSGSVTAARSMTLRNVAGRYMTLSRPHRSVAASLLTGDDDDVTPRMTVEGAASTQSDIVASNGVIHIIDQVLFHSSGSPLPSLSFSSVCVRMSVRPYSNQ